MTLLSLPCSEFFTGRHHDWTCVCLGVSGLILCLDELHRTFDRLHHIWAESVLEADHDGGEAVGIHRMAVRVNN